jgi:iron complex transport system permease protein
MRSRAFWLGGGILAAFAVGILVGSVSLRPAEVWDGLMNPTSPSASIVRELRLPRVLLAFAVGGSLGVCGGALQAMIRNPLADPYLLGLSGGSGLGAVIAISLGGVGRLSVPLAAFAGAMLAIALVYRLEPGRGPANGCEGAASRGRRWEPSRWRS